MLTFKLSHGRTLKKSRWMNKFPRAAFKRLGEHRKTLKVLNYYRDNWNDDNYHVVRGDIWKFLRVNVGRPIDKVFSEYLQRCESSVYYAKEEFELYLNFGDFYVTNGILNYKKKKKKGLYAPKTLINYLAKYG